MVGWAAGDPLGLAAWRWARVPDGSSRAVPGGRPCSRNTIPWQPGPERTSADTSG